MSLEVMCMQLWDIRINSLAADETLDVIDGTLGVGGGLVLSSITDETLCVRERHVGWRDAVTLVVGDDLNASILVDGNARVGGSKIDTDDGSLLRRFRGRFGRFRGRFLCCAECYAADGKRQDCEDIPT